MYYDPRLLGLAKKSLAHVNELRQFSQDDWPLTLSNAPIKEFHGCVLTYATTSRLGMGV